MKDINHIHKVQPSDARPTSASTSSASSGTSRRRPRSELRPVANIIEGKPKEELVATHEQAVSIIRDPAVSQKNEAEIAADEKERNAVLRQCMLLVYNTYAREVPIPGNTELGLKVKSWSLSLAEIPTSQLLRITTEELQNRTDPHMPVPADLLRRWRKGGAPLANIANASAYRPWPKAARPLPAPANECDDEEEIAEYLPEDSGRACFLRLGEQMRRDMEATNGRPSQRNESSRPTPIRWGQILRGLRDWMNMELKGVGIDAALDFGRWLYRRFPVSQWTPRLGEEQWPLWLADGGDEVPAEHRRTA